MWGPHWHQPGQHPGPAEVPQSPCGPQPAVNSVHVGIGGTIHLFCAGGFFFFPKPSFACISITDEIAGVMRDELPEARFVAAADNIVDSSWKGEGISQWGC